MSDEKKTGRGGTRAGAGRPRLTSAPLERISIMITASQRAALKERGDMGAQIRAAIDLYLHQYPPAEP